MKKILAILLTLILVVSVFSACNKEVTTPENLGETEDALEMKAPEEDAEITEVHVLAAASLTDVLNELIVTFETEHPEYKIVPSYAASGALQTQIEEGAPADVFFSAAEKQMNALLEGGFVDKDTHKQFLENKVVLITPKDNPKDIISFQDIGTDKLELIGLGEFESVPVGQYSKEILTNLNFLEALMANDQIVYGSDVRTVLAWVESGEVDCGMVYKTDAAISEDVNIVAEAPEGTLEKPVIYPVAGLSQGENLEGGKAFIDFCSTTESGEKFVEYGFTLVEN